jgi:heme oxygenase (mycobilin-producing)
MVAHPAGPIGSSGDASRVNLRNPLPARSGVWQAGSMSVIKINAITVPADSGDELARRFAGRAGAVDNAPGFEGFELLQPTDGRNVWLVLTRWADEESFEAWTKSRAFGQGHGQEPAEGQGTGHGDRPQGGEGHGGEGRGGGRKPIGLGAELWSYQVADLSTPPAE